MVLQEGGLVVSQRARNIVPLLCGEDDAVERLVENVVLLVALAELEHDLRRSRGRGK